MSLHDQLRTIADDIEADDNLEYGSELSVFVRVIARIVELDANGKLGTVSKTVAELEKQLEP